MITGIDHLVVAVPDLDAATRAYAGQGFAVTPGGRHPASTHNALVVFADGTYLELLAFLEPSPAHRWWGRLQAGGGIIDFCLATDDLDADTATLREAGVVMDARKPGARVRPDGVRLAWITSVPDRAFPGPVPFLIEDVTPRAERVRGTTAHPNGVTGVASLTVAVDDLTGARGWYAALLRAPGEAVRRDDLAAAGVAFAAGRQRIELLAPDGPGRGPSPFAAALRAGRAPAPRLDTAALLGARFSVAP